MQSPAQLLPQSRGIYSTQYETMTNKVVHQFNAQTFGVSMVIAAIIMGAGSQVILHNIDRATAKQCLAHDWPKEADQIHRDWCIASGYKI